MCGASEKNFSILKDFVRRVLLRSTIAFFFLLSPKKSYFQDNCFRTKMIQSLKDNKKNF